MSTLHRACFVLLLLAALSGIASHLSHDALLRATAFPAAVSGEPRSPRSARAALAGRRRTCRVGTQTLPPPQIELPDDCGGVWAKYSKHIGSDLIRHLFSNIDRYRVALYAGRGLAEALRRAAPPPPRAAAAGNARVSLVRPGGEAGADVVLLDDSAFDDAAFCTLSLLQSAHWRAEGRRDAAALEEVNALESSLGTALAALHAERATALRAALAALRPGQVAVVAQTFPLSRAARRDPANALEGAGAAGGARLVRLVVDYNELAPGEARGGALVVPYVSRAEPPFELAFLPAALAAEPLLFTKFLCNAANEASPGMRMRAALFGGDAPALELRAADAAAGGGADGWGGLACMSHVNMGLRRADYLEVVRRSRFCAVLAGDVASSSRLSEIMRWRGACVPVLLGPPWPTLPLLPALDWARLAVFAEMTEPRWLTEDDRAALRERPAGGDDWVPEPRLLALVETLRADGRLLRVATREALVAALAALPDDAVREMRAAGEDARRFFSYSAEGADEAPGAVDVLSAVCDLTEADRTRASTNV